MGLMKFREPNQVRWQGVRPGHNGTQISESISVANGIAIIHTVSADKVFYLCTISISHDCSVAGHGYLYYRDAADLNPVYFLIELKAPDVNTQASILTFWPPLEIPSLFDVCVRSNNVGLTVVGYVFGWEE